VGPDRLKDISIPVSIPEEIMLHMRAEVDVVFAPAQLGVSDRSYQQDDL
jgi:hypothetical protein